MIPDELDAHEARHQPVKRGNYTVCQTCEGLWPCASTRTATALREAWAQIERFDDVLWKKCEEKVDAERERDEQRGRAEKAEAKFERLWGRASRAMRQRDEAEAAIARVRALCDEAEADLDSKHVCGPDCHCDCLAPKDVRAAADLTRPTDGEA